MKQKFYFLETTVFVLCVGALCIAATPIKDLLFQSNVNANGYTIVNLATPINSSDAATKNYVDSTVMTHSTTNASLLAEGTIPDGRLSINVPLLNSASNVFTHSVTVNSPDNVLARFSSTNDFSVLALSRNPDGLHDAWHIGRWYPNNDFVISQRDPNNNSANVWARIQMHATDGELLYDGNLQIRPTTATGPLQATPGNLTVSGTITGNTNIVASGRFIGSGAGLTDKTVPVAALASTPSFRNRVINGDMRIDQRDSGNARTFTAGGANAYCVDRFYGASTGADVTGQRVTSGEYGFQYAYQFTGAAGNTGLIFGQRIESSNVSDLAGTVATLSVYLKSSSLTTVTWKAFYANSSDTFSSKTQIASGSFSISSSLVRYSTNITLPANAANGVAIEFSTGTLTSGNTLAVTGVQLEAGSSATVFEQLPVGVELDLCQRYYWRYATKTDLGAAFLGGITGTSGYWFIHFPVQLRTFPTFSHSSPILTTGTPSGNQIRYFYGVNPTTAGSITAAALGMHSATLTVSGLSSSALSPFWVDLGSGVWFGFDSEL